MEDMREAEEGMGDWRSLENPEGDARGKWSLQIGVGMVKVCKGLDEWLKTKVSKIDEVLFKPILFSSNYSATSKDKKRLTQHSQPSAYIYNPITTKKNSFIEK